MIEKKQENTLHIVFAFSDVTAEFKFLGVFESQEKAQAFVDQVPQPQQECCRIEEWAVNQHTAEDFWQKGYKPQNESESET